MLAPTTPLKRERERRGITAEAFAVAVGVSQPTINRIENGRKRPSPELAKRIAAFLGGSVTRDQILFPEEYVIDGGTKMAKKREVLNA